MPWYNTAGAEKRVGNPPNGGGSKMRRAAVLLLLTVVVFGVGLSQLTPPVAPTPLEKLYFELKHLLDNPAIDLQKALQEILGKYAPIVEPPMPYGDYEKYSINLTELDKALLEQGIWITRATVEIFNQHVVEGPFLLNYNRETGEATGLIPKLRAGKYNVTVKIHGIVEGKYERIVAYGRRDGVEVVRDRITLTEIRLTPFVGTGAILINASVEYDEFAPGDVVMIYPPNGAVDIPLRVSLQYDSLRAKLFDIYFGEEGELKLLASDHPERTYTLEDLKPGTFYSWKVVAKNFFGKTEGPVYTFRTGELPTKPSNPVPYDGATKVWIEPIFLWESERATEFDVYLGTSPDKLRLVATVKEAMYEPPRLEKGTQYFWKVVARNAFGEVSGPVWTFTTGNVPTKPILLEPKGEKVWYQPTFRWSSEDAYEFDLYLGTAPASLELIETTTESEYTPPYNLKLGEKYFWKVVARNDFGESESDVETFQVGDTPKFVAILRPLDGEEDVWVETELAWIFECADSYDVYFGKSPDELDVIATDLKEEKLVVKGLALGTTYFWKVVAKNRFGETESPLVRFTVGDVPAVPFDPEPPDGAVDQFRDVVLSWKSRKADTYDVFFGFRRDSLELIASDIRVNSIRPLDFTELLFGTTYYWKVVAKNRFGKSEGPVWKFTTGNIPEKPVAIYPPDKSTNIPIDVTLKWKSERAEEFELYFGFGFADPLGLKRIAVLKSDEYKLPRLHFGTDYSWKVLARNKFGEIESEIFTFKTKLPTITDQEIFGGEGLETPKRFIRTRDGGYVVVASTQSKDLPGFMGESDILVLKFDRNLKLEWMRLLGGTGWDEAADVKEVEDGYLVLGYSLSKDLDGNENKGGWDFALFKLDNRGSRQWTRTYGGTGLDVASRILVTSTGNYLILGTTNSVDGDPGGNIGTWDVWLFMVDRNGSMVEQGGRRMTRVLGAMDRDKGVDVVEVEDGFVVVATTYSIDRELDVPYNHGASDIWFFKVTKDLSRIVVNEAFGGSDEDEASKVIRTSDGNFLIVGYTRSRDGDVRNNSGNWDFWVVKVSPEGKILWQRTYGGPDEDVAYSVAEFPDGGYVIVGYTVSRTATDYKGGVDVWVVDIHDLEAGDAVKNNVRWEKAYGGPLADYGHNVFIEEDGSIVVLASTFSRTGDVPRNRGSSDIWIFRIK